MAAHEDGTVKSGDELQAIYTGAGLDEGESTVGYCRIGERSSRTWFVLHEFAGCPASNYWIEYGSLVGVPIELGQQRLIVMCGHRNRPSTRRWARI
jgi:thiosulfate/3-mercaptopyruvate sulfurtransferase